MYVKHDNDYFIAPSTNSNALILQPRLKMIIDQSILVVLKYSIKAIIFTYMCNFFGSNFMVIYMCVKPKHYFSKHR